MANSLNKVTTKSILDATVATADIADDAVTSAKIADNAVVTAAINADAITAAKIADDAVGAEHIEQLDADLSFADSAKAKFGAGNDLQIHHDGSKSYLVNSTGNLELQNGSNDIGLKSDSFSVKNGADNETMLTATADGAVDLYHNNVKRFETHATGGNFYPGSDATSVRVYGSNNSTVAATIGSTNSDEGFFRAYDGGTMKTWVEARGIAFGGDSADANFLDDYEEGTWTPRMVYYIAGSGGWDNACTFSDDPQTTNAGVYTRIGRVVYFSYYSTLFNITNGGNISAGIDGLPFANAGKYHVINTAHATCFQTSSVNGYVSTSGDLMVFTKIDSTAAATWSTNDSYLMVSGFYFVS